MNNETNQKFIIRTDRAGVFFGEIAERRGTEADLVNVRRLYYWNGATECFGLATSGVTKPNDCKFTVTVPCVTVTGVIEVIHCSDKAVQSIESVKAWTA